MIDDRTKGWFTASSVMDERVDEDSLGRSHAHASLELRILQNCARILGVVNFAIEVGGQHA